MVDKHNSDSKSDIINISSQKMSVRETTNSFLEDQTSEPHCEINALWTAVITQALMDAGSNSKKPEFKKEKARAISWLNGDSDDFNEVCAMADLDQTYVKENAKEAMKRGCKWRKEPNPSKAKRRAKAKDQAIEVSEADLISSKIISGELPNGLVVKSLFAAA